MAEFAVTAVHNGITYNTFVERSGFTGQPQQQVGSATATVPFSPAVSYVQIINRSTTTAITFSIGGGAAIEVGPYRAFGWFSGPVTSVAITATTTPWQVIGYTGVKLNSNFPIGLFSLAPREGGEAGASAYELDVQKNGFVGTLQDWLADIRGTDAVTPRIRFDPANTSMLQVSYDNQVTWTTIGQARGADGITPVKGRDYFDGANGVSVVSGTINALGHLIFTLSDGTTIDVGAFTSVDQVARDAAAAAGTKADNATTTANAAATDASNALTAANSATTTANNASTKATNAQTTADAATTKANTAQSEVDALEVKVAGIQSGVLGGATLGAKLIVIAGDYVDNAIGAGDLASTVSMSDGKAYTVPIVLPHRYTIDQLGFIVTTAATTDADTFIHIYSSAAGNKRPVTQLLRTAAIRGGTTTGYKSATITAITLEANTLYWGLVHTGLSASFRSINADNVLGFGIEGGASGIKYHKSYSQTRSLSTPFETTNPSVGNPSIITPLLIRMRVSTVG